MSGDSGVDAEIKEMNRGDHFGSDDDGAKMENKKVQGMVDKI
jgi:hypothetical protein